MQKNSPPSLAELQNYDVNRAGQIEAVSQTLYDFQTYAQAGQTSLTFFQNPVGSGGKTLADTNMLSAGQLPAPQMFLVESIEVLFFPDGTAASKPSFQGADVLSAFLNDVYAVSKSGWLEFFIGSKPYLREAPIGRFPSKTRLEVENSVATNLTTGAATQTLNSYAAFGGRPYFLKAPILLKPNQNFQVTLNWPAALALAATTTTARVGVVLDGFLYRNSQ